MSVSIVNHGELKLIGIPCISLQNMSSKYHNAKEGLLSVAKHLPNIVNRQVQYGIWPRQNRTHPNSDTHAYILCVEVDSFEGIPEWFFKTTLPLQQCVVAVNNSDNNFEAAGKEIEQYIAVHKLKVDAGDREYTICERYNYEGEGFSRYSMPIVN